MGGGIMEENAGIMERFFDAERYMPHGHCYLWEPQLVWLHVVSDLAVALAYFSIPVTLACLLHKRGQQMPYRWVFVMFAIFIFLCGLTHLVQIVTLWHPYYYLQGVLKAVTAAASVATAVLIYPLVPVLLEKFSQNGGKDKKP